MIFCFVRETKQLTLEEIDRKWNENARTSYIPPWLIIATEVFSVPTSQYISYELNVMLPWFFKSKIFRKKIGKPPPIIERAEKVEGIVEY